MPPQQLPAAVFGFVPDYSTSALPPGPLKTKLASGIAVVAGSTPPLVADRAGLTPARSQQTVDAAAASAAVSLASAAAAGADLTRKFFD